jgi:ATP-dependent exoDNAse (exonuclease V) beta subunit
MIKGALDPPTKAQTKIIESEEALLLVSAAAGSGKTRVLVERYLRHITAGGLRPDQILAITFTRKAAAEMKRRIVDRLTELGRFDDAQVAETGPIQTIHGFCERMLRENSIAAGIDPDFEVLEGSAAETLLEAAIEGALAYIPDENEEAARLVRKLAGKRVRDEPSPHARLERAIRTALSKWRGTGVSLNELAELHQNHIQLLRRWQDSILSDSPEKVQADFRSDESADSFSARLERAYKTAKQVKPRYVRVSIDADLEVAKDSCGLMQLVVQAWSIYEGKLRDDQQLDFTALEASALRLLQRSEATKRRIGEQYRVLLVDEAQDLNPVQHELLGAMEANTRMYVGDGQQSIYGFRQADPALFARKPTQINEERLAQNHPSAELPAENHWSEKGLTKNQRSNAGILNFVDHIFGQVWDKAYVPMSEQTSQSFDDVELWVQNVRDSRLTAEWIRDLVTEWTEAGNRAGDVAILVRKSSTAMNLARTLETFKVPCRVSGGSDRFYTRLEVRDLANALESLTNPYDNFALWAVLRSPFVGLSLDALVLLSHEHLPLVEELRHAVLPSELEEDVERIGHFLTWFDSLSGYADRLAAWEIIAELFSRTPYLENLARKVDAPQLLANVRKLLALAAQNADTGPGAFAEQIREIQAINHKEGDAPATDQNADEVTIMTIHKSKGLEFPVVIIPDVHNRMSWGTNDVEVDPQLKLITTRFEPIYSMFHEWLSFRRQTREEAEEWRVVYVAMTRAQKRLCVTVCKQTNDRLGGKLCGYLKSDWPPAGATIREAPNV